MKNLAIVLLLFCSQLQSQTLSELNKQLESFKSQIRSTSTGVITSMDNASPSKLTSYMSQLGKSNERINFVKHIVLDTKTSAGILNIYAVSYSSNYSKFVLITEDNVDTNVANAQDILFNFDNNQIKVLSHTGSILLRNGKRGSGWSTCFGNCLSDGLDTHGLLGQVIVITGAASAVCPPCGFVSATYLGLLTLGCAGGCYN